MTRPRARFVIALMLTIGLSLTYLYYIRRQPSAKLISNREDHPVQTANAGKRTYEMQEQALVDIKGDRACVIVLESSDGMVFSSTTIPCVSTRRALKEFDEKVRNAVEIIKRERLFDETGRQVGQEIVAIFAPDKGAYTNSAGLLWIRDSVFGYVQSTTLNNILEYEKDHRF